MSDLICFVMMVKNEARGIEKTLLSVKDHVDKIVILDTGSTDDTVDIVHRVFAENAIDGKIVVEKFVDYSTTRNRALALADECGYIFTLMFSGDEYLENGAELRAFLETKRDSKSPFDEAFHTNVSLGCIYPSTRITRCQSGWKYSGVTHEYISKPNHPLPVHMTPGLIVHEWHQQTDEENNRKWRRDEKLLLRELKKHPDDVRTVFYLAQTYRCLGDFVRAKRYYSKRVEMGGYVEEIYDSLFNIADITGLDEDYLKVYAHSPHRAEPLVKLAERWVDTPQVSYLYASHACELPLLQPGKYLFMDEEAYSFRRWELLGRSAWYVGQYYKGVHALNQALKARPGMPHLLENLEWYASKVPLVVGQVPEFPGLKNHPYSPGDATLNTLSPTLVHTEAPKTPAKPG